MEDMLISLYEIDNFTTYIAIAIAALVVLFFLVLFMGKKDQKLEETKRLQKIELDGFKETSVPTQIETPVVNNVIDNNMNAGFVNPVAVSPIEPAVEVPVVNEVQQESTLSTMQELTNGNVEIPLNNMGINTAVNMNMDSYSPVKNQMPAFDSVIPVSTQDESAEPISLSDITVPADNFELPKFKNETFQNVLPTENVVTPMYDFANITTDTNNYQMNQNYSAPVEEAMPIPEPIAMPIQTEAPLKDIQSELVVDQSFAQKSSFGQPIFSSVYVNNKPEVENIIDLTNVGNEDTVVEKPSFNAILGETYDIK